MRGIVVAAAALAATACITLPAAAADLPDVLATVGGKPIKKADVEEHVRAKLIEIESERYEALKEGLDEMISEELIAQEAKARGITPEKLTETEIAAKIVAPTDAEIQKVYDDNKQALGGQTLEQVKPRIVAYLQQQKAEERGTAFVNELKAKYKTTIALRPPVVEVAADGRPAKGPADAPITIIEFSDYECPFCKRAEVSVDQVMQAYPDKVKVVYRDYPLPMHPNARPASEAAACANAQGKFWEYHKKLFDNQTALGKDQLKSYAKDLGLDQAKFDKCVDSNEFKAKVDQDVEAASKVGVTGTPAFFINGRMISGAQPFEKFKEVIDEELATAASKPKS
jgi:protein-disulfide isomerase